MQEGSQLFEDFGCTACHTPTLTTGESDIAALADQEIHPYTDLLLHDMGPGLADGRPDFAATGSEWRTPPLWGIGVVDDVNGERFLLHDGRATTFAEAILWHGGEGGGGGRGLPNRAGARPRAPGRVPRGAVTVRRAARVVGRRDVDRGRLRRRRSLARRRDGCLRREAAIPRFEDHAASAGAVVDTIATLCAGPTESAVADAVGVIDDARARWLATEAHWTGPVMERRSPAVIDWPVNGAEIEELVSGSTPGEIDADVIAPPRRRRQPRPLRAAVGAHPRRRGRSARRRTVVRLPHGQCRGHPDGERSRRRRLDRVVGGRTGRSSTWWPTATRPSGGWRCS